jgi:hypothetical protein
MSGVPATYSSRALDSQPYCSPRTDLSAAVHISGSRTRSPSTSGSPYFRRSISDGSLQTGKGSASSTHTPPVSSLDLPHLIKPNSNFQELDYKEQFQSRRTRKKYRCDECSGGYDHRKNLREHKQTKHRHMRYTCDFEGCGKSMAQKKNLARHKAAKHGLQHGNGRASSNDSLVKAREE